MRDFESDGAFGHDDMAAGQGASADHAAAIGNDERRMHVRAYNHWASLLDGQPFPSIDALEPGDLEDFGPNSVLLDFTAGADNPAIAFLGRRLRAECGLEAAAASLEQIPARSLLSRLTDHYLQIIANRAPIGFEAEFVNSRGLNTLYRGILMPYSSDGETIDFIYGVINWKELAPPALDAELVLEIGQAIRAVPRAEPVPVWADGPHRGDGDADAQDEDATPATPGEADGLADWLEAARQGAHAVRGAESRSRAALYRALGLAYDFATVAKARPDDYAELLADAGLTAQARAPMTPIVKLVFGIGYDKGRLTEFAAALSHGDRLGIAAGGFGGWLEGFAGGLKGVVKAERLARAPAPRADRTEAARAALRTAEPRARVEIEAGEGEFVLLLARRAGGQALDVLGAVEDDALLAGAIRKAAG